MVLTALLAAAASSGCGGTLSVSAGAITGDGPYRAAWQRGWTAVNRDLAAYVATSQSPGVCNKGGTKAGCFEADQRVAADLTTLATQLRRVHVPGPYRSATAQAHRAISADLRGLRLRMSALGPGSAPIAQRDDWFRQANAHFAEASMLARRAYGAFPDWARPTPAPGL